MLMMRMTGRLNKTSPPMIIKRWAFLPFYQVKNLRCRSSAWIDGCPLSSNVWIFVVKLFKSVNFDYLPIIMNSLNFGAHYITGFSFWDRLHNFYTNISELFCQFISWTNWVNLCTIIIIFCYCSKHFFRLIEGQQVMQSAAPLPNCPSPFPLPPSLSVYVLIS